MVFRRRFNQSLRPIHRIKHVIDAQNGVILNVPSSTTLVDAVDAPVLANSDEVETGSKVNGIYLKVEAYATTAGALANIYMIVYKNSGGNLQAAGIPLANAVGINDNKKVVIHQEMVMLEQSVNGNPRTLFVGVIAIPKGMRRFGINDLLVLQTFAPGVNTSVCVQCIYKEFR